jgi:hypothetical protein
VTVARARIWPGPIPGSHEPGFTEQPIREGTVPAIVRRVVPGDTELHALTMGECRMLLGHEPRDGGGLLWHLTISCRARHPSWDEIKTARYRLLGPDLDAAMYLPPVAEYVNVPAQDHVFHVWEVASNYLSLRRCQ